MSHMEEDASRFLKRVVWSIFSVFLWLTLTVGIGAYNGWLVPENGIRAANIIFWIWMALSLALVIWINYRIWKVKFPHG